MIQRLDPIRAAVLSVGLLMVAGCSKPPESGGAASPTSEGTEGEAVQPASTGEPAAATEPGAPNVPWAEKTFEQRQEYMGVFVYPKMKALFQEFDPKGFESFKCQTCHGDDMETVKFEMPNSLFALAKDDPYKAALEYDEKTTKFMAEKVLPTMAELLGEKPGEEFRCLSCHQAE